MIFGEYLIYIRVFSFYYYIDWIRCDMFFSDINFLLLFLLIFIPVYAYVPSWAKRFVLLLGGIIFYAVNDIIVLPFILLDILIVFFLNRGLEFAFDKPKLRSFLLRLGIVLQIALMIVPLFFTEHYFIGIGFFAVQFIGYILDVYKGVCPATHNILDLANYALFFPKVLQGPIVSFPEMAKSLSKPAGVNPSKLEKGIRIFILGLSYKVLLADRLNSLWNGVQTVGFQSLSTPLTWISMYSYSIQLFLDFQGYSLMAIGVAYMLGFTLPVNFQSPYMSRSVGEFYRRWHMTLGQWFKNYVYIPMGGSRNGTKKMLASLSVVWLLTGLWHGISVHFLMWAGLLLICIILEKTLFKKLVRSENIILKFLGHAYVLAIIPMSWMLFAIPDIDRIYIFFMRLFDLQNYFQPINVNSTDYITYLKDYWPYLLGGTVCCFPIVENILVKTRVSMTRFISFALFWLCVYIIMKNGNNPFMYVNF